MNQASMKQQTIAGFLWRYAERCGAQGIQFLVSIVLARLLSPSDYGIIGIITVFIALANVFISCGFGQALIQKKDADETDFSSVFYFNIAMALILYMVMFFSAPAIAHFYNNDILTPVIRVLSITLVIGGVNGVQQAYVQKTMQFKRFFWATLGGTIISAVVGIAFAYKGLGVWALVAQQLTNQMIDTVILWITVKWRPILRFSVKKMKRLFAYGWKLLCSSLLDVGYNNMYSLIIGKFYSSADLGFYNRGKQFPILIIDNINSSINSVLFPVLAKVQDEKEKLKAMMRRSMTTSIFIIFPCMAGLAAIAEPLVKILLTDKWLPAVPFIRFCCFTYAFWPVHTANLQAIKAIGRSDIFLKLEIAKKVLGIITLCVTLPFGLTVMMWGRCVSTIIGTFINAYPNKKLLGYSYMEQVKDMMPTMVLSVLMACIVWSLSLLNINAVAIMLLQVFIGSILYVFGAKLLKLECFEYVLNMVKEVFRKIGYGRTNIKGERNAR